jgi:hypothetical protein
VPVDGFYEWHPKGQKSAQPYLFHRANGDPLVFAGLREWHVCALTEPRERSLYYTAGPGGQSSAGGGHVWHRRAVGSSANTASSMTPPHSSHCP